MFNLFRDKDEVSVKGKVEIDGVDYIIERTVTRKLKRNGSEYTTRTDLSFYRILPDGTIENLEVNKEEKQKSLLKSLLVLLTIFF